MVKPDAQFALRSINEREEQLMQASVERAAKRFREPDPHARVFYEEVSSPVGTILLTSDGTALTRCQQESAEHIPEPSGATWRHDAAPLLQAIEQLEQYFAGERQVFDLVLAPRGTAFQREVWAALLDIAYARCVSYGDIAAAIGRPNAYRAVGSANGANPISIIVPCHRVIASDGTLGGYGYGLERKVALLELEKRHLVRKAPSNAAIAVTALPGAPF